MAGLVKEENIDIKRLLGELKSSDQDEVEELVSRFDKFSFKTSFSINIEPLKQKMREIT